MWAYKMAKERMAGHQRSCVCAEVCEVARTAQISLQIAENIRDLWGELSWMAAEKGWGPAWMDWFYEELEMPSRTPGWWSSRATHQPMGYWYLRWERWRKKAGV